ncbi:MAG: TonB-dependent receptor [Acidobacteria bacterium]|nr:TonB-dependent receptor [Acidobacteriota bacterium]
MRIKLPLQLLACCLAASAQRTASLTGTVSDASGAVVAGAAIHARNTQTGEGWQASSNNQGIYNLPLLPPGAYEVRIEKTGFKTHHRSGLVLETGVPSRVDIALEVGGVAESVTVSAEVPQLQAETATVGAVVKQETIANMPLIDRRAAQLARLSGFVVQNGTGSNFTMAGGRGDNSAWSLDGGVVQNITLGNATLDFDPPIDSLEEFQVNISNYKAELGRTGGGVVQMTTRSGTNRFHGTAYDFIRNNALEARPFFSGPVKPRLRRHQYGASLGGPVKRDRTHFFYSFEGVPFSRGAAVFQNVPGPGEASGDFSRTGRAIRDPLANAPFPGAVIPQSRMDPVGARLAALYPAPNVAGAPSRNNNFTANQRTDNPMYYHVARMDHVVNDKHRVFGRFLSFYGNTRAFPMWPEPGTDSFHDNRDRNYFNVSGTWFWNVSPEFINELRYSWVRRCAPNSNGSDGLDWPKRLGLTGTNERFFPIIRVTGLAVMGRDNGRNQCPIAQNMIQHTMTKVRGKHTLKWGWEYRASENKDIFYGSAGGDFEFNPQATNDALASLLLGWTNRAFREDTLPLITHADTYGAFVQTDWKVSQRLTLNLGLRWDMDQPRHEIANNRQNSFDRGLLNPVCNCPGAVRFSGRDGVSRYAHNFDKNNFGPRLGFALQLTPKTVLRGGGAVVYIGQYDQATPIVANLGFSVRGEFVSPDAGRTAAFLLRDGLPPIKLPAEADLTSSFGAVRPGQPVTTAVDFFEPQRANGYLNTLNLNVQHQLPGRMLAEIGYLATLGHKLPAPDFRGINQVPPALMGPGNAQVRRPFPQFSSVRTIAPAIGNSNYHGLNLKIEKRASGGLSFGANYTWSKLIDDVESRGEIGGNIGVGAFADFYNRGGDKGLSGNHIGHRLIANTVWEVPFGRGRAHALSNPVANQILGGWILGLILELRSGSSFGVVEAATASANAFVDTLRSNVVGAYQVNPAWRSNVRSEPFFATGAFAAPAPFTLGNAGRTIALGPGSVAADVSVLKDFPVIEGHRIQFRAEVLNFPNHPNFGLPAQARGNANFGRVASLANGNQSRIFQLGLHYKF